MKKTLLLPTLLLGAAMLSGCVTTMDRVRTSVNSTIDRQAAAMKSPGYVALDASIRRDVDTVEALAKAVADPKFKAKNLGITDVKEYPDQLLVRFNDTMLQKPLRRIAFEMTVPGDAVAAKSPQLIDFAKAYVAYARSHADEKIGIVVSSKIDALEAQMASILLAQLSAADAKKIVVSQSKESVAVDEGVVRLAFAPVGATSR